MDYRYYICSSNLTEEEFASGVRAHWGIENSLHWVLDATMKKDSCHVFRKNAAQNIASLRHIALKMMRAESTKLSIRMKRKRAWMKTEFLEQILMEGFSKIQ